MFKCHFDAGFIDTQYNVVHQYFNQYFPQAIEVARTANAEGKRRYVWTTGSWLCLNTWRTLRRGIARAWRKRLRGATLPGMLCPSHGDGDVFPIDHRRQPGAVKVARSAVRQSDHRRQDDRCSRTPRGIIPPLAKHGVTFLEIGVNGGSTVAQLPPIFLWRIPPGKAFR